MIGAVILSLTITVLFVLLLLLAAAVLASQVQEIRSLLQLLDRAIGAVPIAFMVGLVLWPVSYLLLTSRTIRHIEELERAVNQVANGQFDIAIPIRSENELGRLARNMERMTAQLKLSIEQERKAQQMKYELITSLSHDLRTPLTSMLGYLQLVEQDKYRDEVELRYYVGTAYQKSLQLKRMIDQLFEFTRTTHGSLKLRPVTISLGQLLEQLAEEFMPQLQEADMAYRLHLPPERVEASVDPDLLVRLLQNLMTNAIRYGREGKRVDLELERQGNQVVLRIANYGEPIPEGELPHIFESFYRVEKSRSERTGGAGLGLAIAKNIATLHGGSIRAYNESERTVFEVRLPGTSVAPGPDP